MGDLELLEKYEPVLRFAKSERFFPTAVEPYLERCQIFPSGPQGAVGMLFHFNEPLVRRIGNLPGSAYYLRFVNEVLYDSDVWVWWGILSVIGLGIGWFTVGVPGVEIAIALSLIAALIIFMLASTIRLRIIPAAFAALFFIALEVAPIWFFLRTHSFMSVQIEYLVLLPIYLLVLFYLSVRTLKFIFDHIIPEGPGLIMDMLSQATETIARKAYFQYAKILEKDPQPVYYGRVMKEHDKQGNEWTILQYHFFYAFNDWRLAANGMNHHEADWELISVYLRNGSPHAVLMSQHGAGNIEYWENVFRAEGANGQPTLHPIIYSALGSHANYARPEVIRSPSLYKKGFVQRFLYRIDGLLHFLFLVFNPSQKARENALREWTKPPMFLLTEENLQNLRDEADHYVVSLPMEISTGDGIRIGPEANAKNEPLEKSSSYLKRVMSDRRVTRPTIKEWRRILLEPEPEWVQYKGLWGVKSLLKDESGPPGPKWDRPDKLFNVNPRKRWEKPLEWLEALEENTH